MRIPRKYTVEQKSKGANILKNIEQLMKELQELPELGCNLCGVVFKGTHECEYEKLKEKVVQYEKALKTIKGIGDYYTERGWALNPDKIEKIIDKALES